MNTQSTEPYKRAWKNYEMSGHDVTRLSAADVAALRSDDTTRATIDGGRPVDVTPRPTTTKAAAIPPPWPDWDEAATALAEAIAAGRSGDETKAYGIIDAVDRFAGQGSTPRAQFIRALMTLSVLKAAVALIGQCETRIEALEANVKELKAKPSLKFAGVYNGGVLYQPGDVVVHDGSCWHANVKDAGDRPGTSAAFTLIVKKGKDGKHAPGAA